MRKAAETIEGRALRLGNDLRIDVPGGLDVGVPHLSLHRLGLGA
jgi:hypothetical protein